MAHVLVVGGATIDTIIQYENMESLTHHSNNQSKHYLLLEEGHKIEVTQQSSVSGGGATNAAVSFSRQGFEVNILSKIGEDLAGEQIRDELKTFGINIDYLKIDPELGTGTSFVVPALSGDRTVFAYRGANTQLQSGDISDEAIEQSDFIYVTSLSGSSSKCLPEIISKAQNYNKPVALNPGMSQLKLGAGFLNSSLYGVDTLILNYEEAEQLMYSLMHVTDTDLSEINEPEILLSSCTHFNESGFNLKQFFAEILKLGPSTAVVTNGSKGVYVATQAKLYYQSAPKVNAVNTLGAGDAFGSGFIANLFGNKDCTIEEAIQLAVANSVSVIAHPDAKTGLKSLSELQKYLINLNLKPVKAYDWDEV